jgi:enoyl-CoA hydratase/carnithine racemase
MTKVRLEVTDGVAVVTLNRPESLNALDAETHALLAATWVEIKSRPEIRSLVFTGTGRGFCVGMDLKQVGERGEFRKTDTTTAALQTMTPLSNDIWLPTIVAVNGVCAGGGLHFVADADIVVASTAATFTDPHVTYGQVAALEPIGLIPRIGLGNSLRLALLGRSGRFDAAEALRVCLVDEVVEPDELLPRSLELATAIAQNSPAAVRATKRAIWESLDVPMAEAMQHGWKAFQAHRHHPDALEGPRAFAERRPPVWSEIEEPGDSLPTGGE